MKLGTYPGMLSLKMGGANHNSPPTPPRFRMPSWPAQGKLFIYLTNYYTPTDINQVRRECRA